MTRSRLTLSVVLALTIPLTVFAQDSRDAWGGQRAFLNFNVGVQTASPDFAYAAATPLWGETATAAQNIAGKRGPAFDIGGGARLVQNFGVAVVYSRYSQERTATLTTTIPNPLQSYGYGQPATAERQVPLVRDEDAVHLQAMYRMRLTSKMHVGVSGGPSFFRCLDDVVNGFAMESQLSGVSLEQMVWSVDYTRITQTTTKDTSWGYNGGADLTYQLARHFGVGTTVRYSRAAHETVNILAKPDPELLDYYGIWSGGDTAQTVTMRHGGFHWNGGFSFRF